MTVLLSDVGSHGRLNLTFSSRHGRTTIRDAYCEVPFKVTRLHDSASFGIAHLILMHSTAGVFGGDVLDCAIHVEAGARVLITQQSSMKVHPSCGRIAVQRSRIRVEAGGELHIWNRPIIPFAGSRLRQTTKIDLAHGSRFYFWESLMAGRIGSGEVWRFDELTSETGLSVDERLLFLDRFSLRPPLEPPTPEWMMGAARYFGAGLCFDEDASDLADRLHCALPSAGVDTPASGLTVVRVVANEGPEFYSMFKAGFVHATNCRRGL